MLDAGRSEQAARAMAAATAGPYGEGLEAAD